MTTHDSHVMKIREAIDTVKEHVAWCKKYSGDDDKSMGRFIGADECRATLLTIESSINALSALTPSQGWQAESGPTYKALGMINLPHPDHPDRRIVGLIFKSGESPFMWQLREAYDSYWSRSPAPGEVGPDDLEQRVLKSLKSLDEMTEQEKAYMFVGISDSSKADDLVSLMEQEFCDIVGKLLYYRSGQWANVCVREIHLGMQAALAIATPIIERPLRERIAILESDAIEHERAFTQISNANKELSKQWFEMKAQSPGVPMGEAEAVLLMGDAIKFELKQHPIAENPAINITALGQFLAFMAFKALSAHCIMIKREGV